MSTETSLHNTPLLKEHIALGAKMVGFGGWNMPLQYDGILAEWDYNRKTCSIFDCSHMGEFLIKGDAVGSGLDRIVTQTIVDMPIGACRYGAMLNTQGGVIDDLIVYRKAKEEWMIVVNASNIEKDARHFKANLSAAAGFTDISFQTAKLDLQGPLSRDVLCDLLGQKVSLEYYTFAEFILLGEKCVISRTGYTGELGYEIYYPWGQAVKLWQAILKDGRVKPTGLGVRDVLRIEMCYSLYGHELAEDIHVLECGLEKFLDFNKDFIGKAACLACQELGVKRTIGYIQSASRKSPRAGHKVYNSSGKAIGEVVSGTYAVGVGAGIGIAFVQKNEKIVENKIVFGDDRSTHEAAFVKRPFYKNGSLRS